MMPELPSQEEDLICTLQKEFRAHTNQLQQVLRYTGISEHDFSKAGRAYLDVLARLASVLDLQEESTGSYIHVISELQEELRKTCGEHEKVRGQLLSVKKLAQKLIEDSRQLKRVEKDFQEAVQNRNKQIGGVEELRSKTQVLRQKEVQYTSQLKHVDELLDREAQYKSRIERGESVDHGDIIKWSKQWRDLEQENQEMEKELSVFHKLPIDPILARAKLQEAKEELHELDVHFDAQIRKMA